jgi:hypothetical protein
MLVKAGGGVILEKRNGKRPFKDETAKGMAAVRLKTQGGLKNGD